MYYPDGDQLWPMKSRAFLNWLLKRRYFGWPMIRYFLKKRWKLDWISATIDGPCNNGSVPVLVNKAAPRKRKGMGSAFHSCVLDPFPLLPYHSLIRKVYCFFPLAIKIFIKHWVHCTVFSDVRWRGNQLFQCLNHSFSWLSVLYICLNIYNTYKDLIRKSCKETDIPLLFLRRENFFKMALLSIPYPRPGHG